MSREFIVGIDIGAGSGAKVALFDGGHQAQGEALLPVHDYGSSADAFAEALLSVVRGLLSERGLSDKDLLGAGVAAPGAACSDGSLCLVANIPFLNGVNLCEMLGGPLGVPVALLNDADAGALAVWSREKTGFLYWVLGGGWGGAWVSAEGRVLFPSTDWKGDDEALHYTNEPGYSIPLDKERLRELFSLVSGSFETFEEVCSEEAIHKGRALSGPSGRVDCVRAELLVSGTGRWRMFRALAGKDESYESYLSVEEMVALGDPAMAGAIINRLNSMDVESAVRTDGLFGKIFAEAAAVLFRQARRDGCSDNIPIFLAGGPSKALDLFGPTLFAGLRSEGISSEVRVSGLEQDGVNANLLGAALAAGWHAKAE